MILPRPVVASGEDEAPKLVDAFSALLDAEEGDGAAFVAGPIEMVGAPAPVPSPTVEWTPGRTAAASAAPPAEPAPVEAVAETVAFQAVATEAAEAADAPGAVAEPAEVEVAEASAATVMIPRPLQAVPAPSTPAEAVAPAPHDAPTTAASPGALRTDAPDHSAIDGIDLDVFADAVAQKILHRLTDARIDAIVSERVLEIAERLVREEIDRIKADAQ